MRRRSAGSQLSGEDPGVLIQDLRLRTDPALPPRTHHLDGAKASPCERRVIRMEAKQVQTQFESKGIVLQTGHLAKLADGAVVIACGDTTVLVTAVASPTLREGIDFFPLTV